MGEIGTPIEPLKKPPLDVVIVCGMGPLRLKLTRVKDNLVGANIYNTLNGVAAKILIERGIAGEVVMSGTTTRQVEEYNPRVELDKLELQTSEAMVLEKTFTRARPKGTKVIQYSGVKSWREDKADSTFGNIIESLNLLDIQAGGYWKGSLGILAPEFHTPRIVELIKIYGLQGGRVLSSEATIRNAGYSLKLDHIQRASKNSQGEDISYQTLDTLTYEDQPNKFANLVTHPAYLTCAFADIVSNQRFWEFVTAAKNYYSAKNIPLPQAYNKIPKDYDSNFDYTELRQDFKDTHYDKLWYRVEKENIISYRQLAEKITRQTENFLQENK